MQEVIFPGKFNWPTGKWLAFYESAFLLKLESHNFVCFRGEEATNDESLDKLEQQVEELVEMNLATRDGESQLIFISGNLPVELK